LCHSRGSRLKLIIQYGVGLEGVDIPAATQKGVWV
jgi:lactate dehydrogenase-like 2-hydroxyacid dehydrogenase